MAQDTPKVAINGFGRIGRLVARNLIELGTVGELVAINDLSPPEILAHLFEFDSVHGRWNGNVEVDGHDLQLDGHRLRVYQERDPANLPWGDLDVDYVVDATGRFRDRAGLGKHLEAGAKRVVLSAPGKDVDVTLVRGVNMHAYDPGQHRIISNASCTTNCLAPVLKVMNDAFGVDHAVMTTIHAYTNDQVLLDTQHKDLRRSRAAALSMIPTSTGAASAIGKVLPELAGKVSGMAVRVPTANVSLVDLTAQLPMSVEMEDLGRVFHEAANGHMKGVLAVADKPLVSVDFNHDPHSAIVDLPGSMVVDHALVKVLAWYDNEWAYARRVAEVLADMWAQEPEQRGAEAEARAQAARPR